MEWTLNTMKKLKEQRRFKNSERVLTCLAVTLRDVFECWPAWLWPYETPLSVDLPGCDLMRRLWVLTCLAVTLWDAFECWPAWLWPYETPLSVDLPGCDLMRRLWVLTCLAVTVWDAYRSLSMFAFPSPDHHPTHTAARPPNTVLTTSPQRPNSRTRQPPRRVALLQAIPHPHTRRGWGSRTLAALRCVLYLGLSTSPAFKVLLQPHHTTPAARQGGEEDL